VSDEKDLPVAVRSGEIMGVKVHVLDDGRRLIDAEDLERLFRGEIRGLDLAAFAVAFGEWAGQTGSAAQEPKS
jgi:hypothetical protein